MSVQIYECLAETFAMFIRPALEHGSTRDEMGVPLTTLPPASKHRDDYLTLSELIFEILENNTLYVDLFC